jgi:hypothetical protein
MTGETVSKDNFIIADRIEQDNMVSRWKRENKKGLQSNEDCSP